MEAMSATECIWVGRMPSWASAWEFFDLVHVRFPGQITAPETLSQKVSNLSQRTPHPSGRIGPVIRNDTMIKKRLRKLHRLFRSKLQASGSGGLQNQPW